jgi:hypothetical protein
MYFIIFLKNDLLWVKLLAFLNKSEREIPNYGYKMRDLNKKNREIFKKWFCRNIL